MAFSTTLTLRITGSEITIILYSTKSFFLTSRFLRRRPYNEHIMYHTAIGYTPKPQCGTIRLAAAGRTAPGTAGAGSADGPPPAARAHPASGGDLRAWPAGRGFRGQSCISNKFKHAAGIPISLSIISRSCHLPSCSSK
jgi:hypothetical protein